jgi:hypothetical protein
MREEEIQQLVEWWVSEPEALDLPSLSTGSRNSSGGHGTLSLPTTDKARSSTVSPFHLSKLFKMPRKPDITFWNTQRTVYGMDCGTNSDKRIDVKVSRIIWSTTERS